MHVVAYLPVTHRSSRASFGAEVLSSGTNKGCVTIPQLKYEELKKSLLQMHIPLSSRIKFSDLASESQRTEACVNVAWELQYWPCCEALNQEPRAPSWTYFNLECVPQQYEPSKCMANFSPFPQPVFLGQRKREETGRKIRPPLPQFLTGTPFFCEVGALTVVTFAHIKIIALLWKTEPDLNATFINFTNTKRLLNMRQVFLNMTSRRLWQSEIDGFKSLLGWKMPLEILSPAGLRFMPYGSNQNANFLPLATCWIWALQEDTQSWEALPPL